MYVLVTTCARANYGDPAKEINVGLYKVQNRKAFEILLSRIQDNPKKWMSLDERKKFIIRELSRRGYRPVSTITHFVPI
ncbi:MAG: hypothetical protein A2928_00310 [Candidatus Taylorbacteria bacterium RIFCSPLOWO2_01_FULL_45_15b]|uniref:Uncharacterized protein n=1 Tax=Candidatus Taylorbacteria bacterium RIFCSPLOWO2_01_FULL_45_15b TaxID=1802319 RepID=A0A1G2N7B9_9BACT|nr:MAG: hypothetical protein A2928_00310 [Candidatus Taylorbacteria bacterium RIFCSPLOWO2_01_FULL_45_15b]